MTETEQRDFFIAKTPTDDISPFPRYVLWINLHKEFLNNKGAKYQYKGNETFPHKNRHGEVDVTQFTKGSL
jgi:hypothetical protein